MGEYTCFRNTRRWPLLLLFHMVDLASIKAFIYFTSKYQEYEKGKTLKRPLFLKDLRIALLKPLIAERPQDRLPKYIENAMTMILRTDGTENEQLLNRPNKNMKNVTT